MAGPRSRTSLRPDNSASLPHSSPGLLGRSPDKPVPVELAVRGAGNVLRKRFDYDLWVGGELIDLVRTSEGHGFGVLRGPGTRIDVYLAPRFMRHRDLPQRGSLVLVRGRLAIWEPGGRFQVTASGPLVPTNLPGARAETRRAVERRLRAEGVLNRRRRALPQCPAKVAVVTSVSGAAMRDVHATIHRRARWVRISVHGCVVQGHGAAASIIGALDAADASDADVVLLTRGGGAPDDFDPFDDPRVVRRVGRSRLPIVVAIGHEGDNTFAELAADHAASTPTAAAELAVPDGEALQREVSEHRRRLHAAARAICSAARARAEHSRDATNRETLQRLRLGRERLRRVDPGTLTASLYRLLKSERKRLDGERDAVQRMASTIVREQRRRATALRPAILVTHGEATIRADRHRADELRRAIHALSPERVLARGYALVLDANGSTVSRSGRVGVGDTLRIRLRDGEVAAVVAGPEIPQSNQGEEE